LADPAAVSAQAPENELTKDLADALNANYDVVGRQGRAPERRV
jgi:hypothetical protein